MAASVLDQYPQFAIGQVAGLAATSGFQFSQIVTGMTNMQKMGWKVSRIEYFFPELFMAALTTAADYVSLGLMASVGSASVDPQAATTYDMAELITDNTPSSSNARNTRVSPIIHVWSEGDQPLVLVQNIYVALKWNSTANLPTTKTTVKIYYKEVELGPQDWYDLLQMRLPLGAI
jgi:hypothetical protein